MIVHEMNGSVMPFTYFKNLCDEYPLQVEYKFGFT